MTKQDAINTLEDMKIDIPVPKAAVTQRKRNVALDMAISALNCSEFPNSSDTISRQAALDVLDAYQVMVENGEENPYAWARRRMCELSSVQPERKQGEWIVDKKRFGDNEYHCNQCGAILEGDALVWRNNYYCYHCGVEMRGKNHERIKCV